MTPSIIRVSAQIEKNTRISEEGLRGPYGACDGAKPSCAAKIASAVDAAIMAHHLSADGKVFSGGEGLVMADVECTIADIGRMASEGMKSTDVEILRLMIGDVP